MSSEFRGMLNLQYFLELAQEEDLFAIVRPGPYVCAGLDYGGLPSWLLRESDMEIRSSNTNFINQVTRFWNTLLQILVGLQFVRGGPIISFQVCANHEHFEARKGVTIFFNWF